MYSSGGTNLKAAAPLGLDTKSARKPTKHMTAPSFCSFLRWLCRGACASMLVFLLLLALLACLFRDFPPGGFKLGPGFPREEHAYWLRQQARERNQDL